MLPATISTAPLALMSMQSTVAEALTSAPLVVKTSAELITHPQLEIVVVHEAADAARTPTSASITDASAATAANPKVRDSEPVFSLMIECRIAGFLPPRLSPRCCDRTRVQAVIGVPRISVLSMVSSRDVFIVPQKAIKRSRRGIVR